MSTSSNLLSNKFQERKVRKPKIEKLRRARINTSLEQLKDILLRNTISIPQGTRPMKLDKADILAMTVKYVEMLHDKLSSEAQVEAINSSPKKHHKMENLKVLRKDQRWNSDEFSDVTNLITNEKCLDLMLNNGNKSSSSALPTSLSSTLWFYNRFNLHQRNQSRMCVGKENVKDQMRKELNGNFSSESINKSIFTNERHWRPW